MRELGLWLAQLVLVGLMTCYRPLLWLVVEAAHCMTSKLDALEFELLLARTARLRKPARKP